MPDEPGPVPRSTLGRVGLSTALFLLSIGLAHAEAPRPMACTADGELSADNPSVVVRHGYLQDSNSNASYPYRILGLGALDPDYKTPPYRMCLRYVFLNDSGEKIVALRWPDAVANFVDIPEDEAGRYRTDQLTDFGPERYDPPVIGNTVLRAFDGWRTSVSETVMTLEQHGQRQRTSPGSASLSWFDARYEEPNLADLALVGASYDSVQGLSTGADSREYPVLRSGMTHADVDILIETAASYLHDRSLMTVSTRLYVSAPDDASVDVYAPVFFAMEEYETHLYEQELQQHLLEENIVHFMAVVSEHRYEPLGLYEDEYNTMQAFPAGLREGRPTIFIARHPVTVVWGENQTCINATTYSPVPVSVDDAYCNYEVKE